MLELTHVLKVLSSIPVACESEVISASGVGNGPKVITGNGAIAEILMDDSFLKSICNTRKRRSPNLYLNYMTSNNISM